MVESLSMRLTSTADDLGLVNKHFNEENLSGHAEYHEVAHLVMQQEAVEALERQVLELDPNFLEAEAQQRQIIRATKVEVKTQCEVEHWHKERE